MKKTVYTGMLLSCALLLSYVESLIPFGFGVPGIKLGLANLAVVLCLYQNHAKTAFLLNLIRILLAGFLFGSLYSILYALAGGLVSFFVMWAAKKTEFFTIRGVSVLGGVFHNIAQLLIAAFVVRTAGVFYLIPYLLLAGVITGWLIGFLTGILEPYLTKTERKIL